MVSNIQDLCSLKTQKSTFTQLVGREGSGCRRLCFDFIPPESSVLWMTSRWRIYAPLLWKLAEDKKIQVFGLECPRHQKLRSLWHEVYESEAFDVWILENINLRQADGFFLKRLLQHSPVQVLCISPQVFSFCEKRAHIQLSHQNYRIVWTKGKKPSPQYKPASYLRSLQEDLCTLY